MRVEIRGQPYVAVAEQLTDLRKLDVLRQKNRRRTMSQILKSHVRQTCRLEHAGEYPQHVALAKGRTHLHFAALPFTAHAIGREHQAGVNPSITRFQALFQLPRPMRLQPVKADLREFERAAAFFGSSAAP